MQTLGLKGLFFLMYHLQKLSLRGSGMGRKVLTFGFVLDEFPVKFSPLDTMHNGPEMTSQCNTPISSETGQSTEKPKCDSTHCAGPLETSS